MVPRNSIGYCIGFSVALPAERDFSIQLPYHPSPKK